MRNNKNVYNYECLLKRMLYCAGNGQELLSALGVTLVCRARTHNCKGFFRYKRISDNDETSH